MSSEMKDWPIVSYSQMQSWDRCEVLWDYAYARNWTRNSKATYFNFGTEVHLVFKVWYDLAIARVPKPERFDKIRAYWAERINKYHDNYEMLDIIRRAMAVTDRYFVEFAPLEDKGHQILKTEHHFTVPFQTKKGRNFILQGYIDLLTKRDNRLWAWDHKTMESTFWTPTQVMMEPQTPLYEAALRMQGDNVHGCFINMVNSYDYKDMSKVPKERLFSREPAYRTDIQLNNVVREMKMIVDDIIENSGTPRRSLRLDCKNCSFQKPCLMRLKGIDDEPLLREEYSQKDKYEVELKLDPERLIQHA
jgi:hypothetical protein